MWTLNIADETLTDYSFLSRYHYSKSKNYLKRRYRIRHWIPMFIGTPCIIKFNWWLHAIANLFFYLFPPGNWLDLRVYLEPDLTWESTWNLTWPESLPGTWLDLRVYLEPDLTWKSRLDYDSGFKNLTVECFLSVYHKL